MNLYSVIESTEICLVLAILLGLSVPFFGSYIEPVILPLLILLLTISLSEISLKKLSVDSWSTVSKLILLNYGVFTAVMIVAGIMFVEELYQPAFILMALMPPSIGILGLTKLFRGNLSLSFVVELISYTLALFFIPYGVSIFIGESVPLRDIIETLVMLIIVPFILSRIVRYVRPKKSIIEKEQSYDWSKALFNIVYFLLFYSVIAMQQSQIVSNLDVVFNLLSTLFIIRIGLGFFTYVAALPFVDRETLVSYVLFSSFKSTGTALGFVVLLFGVEGTLPVAINGLLVPVQVLMSKWLLQTIG